MAPRDPLSYRCPEFIRQSMLAIGDDRAWIMSVLVGLANTVLLAAGKLSGGEYIAGLSIVFSVYTGARVYVKAKTADGAL